MQRIDIRGTPNTQPPTIHNFGRILFWRPDTATHRFTVRILTPSGAVVDWGLGAICFVEVVRLKTTLGEGGER